MFAGTADGLTESLARRPLPDVIAERITATIANGTLTPGQQLPSEPELAKQLQVGRTSLREALRKLATLGVIEIVRGKGTFVCEPPENATTEYVKWGVSEGSALTEVLEARMSLEAAAAGLACARAADDEIRELRRLCEAHDNAHADDDVDALVRTDEEFHEAIVHAGHNVALTGLYKPLVPEMAEFRRHRLSLARAQDRSDDHAYIVAAIEKRDPVAARQAVIKHLWIFYQEVRAVASPTGDGEFPETVEIFL